MVFHTSNELAEGLLTKSIKVAKGNTLNWSGIEIKWLAAYGTVADLADPYRQYGLILYPYDPVPAVSVFIDGFSDHRKWPFSKSLEKHNCLRSVADHRKNI